MYEDNIRVETYKDGQLVEVVDTRTVSVQAQRRISEIKEACAKAIEETGIAWMVQREVTGGTPVPQDVKDACAAHRQRSNDLEAQIQGYVDAAKNDEDKVACDLIEKVNW